MTEQEAKTKWCPAFRGNNHGVNRPDALKTDAGLGFCIGSACMAWRSVEGHGWASEFRGFLNASRSIDAIRLYRNETGATLRDAKTFVEGVIEGTIPPPPLASCGFCGLAGKP
jgi:hypothetical protein